MTGIMNTNEREMACKHFLAGIKGIGRVTARKLLDFYDAGSRIWELTDGEIMKDRIMTLKQKNALLGTRQKWDLEKEWERLKEKRISMVAYCDEEYPTRLRNMDDKPFVMYYKGMLPKNNVPSVAIIGARMCTEYGRYMAGYFGAELAKRGIQIISGMASGIDGIAQKSALEHGGSSYGVLGCGVDICYPVSNRPLYEMLLMQGGILSEFLPGEAPEAGHFPMRNRLISGLADLVLVVEAKEKSGTRITVELALEQGKEVYAVPGRVKDELSTGCNLLIREGAGIALDAEEIASVAVEACRKHYNVPTDESGISEMFKVPKIFQTRKLPEAGYTEKKTKNESVIFNLLREKAMSMDEIYNRLKIREDLSDEISFRTVQETMTDLMLQGKVACQMGLYEAIYHN